METNNLQFDFSDLERVLDNLTDNINYQLTYSEKQLIREELNKQLNNIKQSEEFKKNINNIIKNNDKLKNKEDISALIFDNFVKIKK